jgi:hypothetical protein
MPAPWTPPPALLVDDLAFSAKIDYITLGPYPAKTKLPALVGSVEDVPPSRNTGRRRWLTVHDPVRDDIIALDSVLGLALVVGLEIAVDLRPTSIADPDRAKRLLVQTFLSIAARFRPEDQALWDHSKRGAVKQRGGNVEPLERRQARLGEEVIYGGRHEDMQAKLYLKTLDHGAELPLAEQSVRMEITLRRWACKVSGIDHVADLLGYPFRKKFTTHFRVIDRPELRAATKLDPVEREKRTKRMLKAWSKAGVGKFAVGDRPREDKLIPAVKRVKARERAQLPADHYKLIRDQRANAKIGAALMTLQRRMAR